MAPQRADVHGITALLAAAWEGHTETVKQLLALGADKSGKAPDGNGYAEQDDLKSEIKDLLS